MHMTAIRVLIAYLLASISFAELLASHGLQHVLQQASLPQRCLSHNFHFPYIPGSELIELNTALVKDQPFLFSSTDSLSDDDQVSLLNYCKVSIYYSHSQHADEIHVEVWLPTDNWNGRMQGTGGGGYATGFQVQGMQEAIRDGYAVTSTDGGHNGNVFDPSDWAFTRPGHIDMHALKDFASTTLHEAAVIGKAITALFYHRPPGYSYFNGCSTGGRQGLMLAQKYPEDYDGILAAAPAINWPTFIVQEFYLQAVMNEMKAHPHPCELDTITAAAISHCDKHDGVEDGILSDPSICTFDPYTLVGTLTPPCPQFKPYSRRLTITKAAAIVAKEAWTVNSSLNHLTGGPLLWPGLSPETPLSLFFALASTVCDPVGTYPPKCKGFPFPLSLSWIQTFIHKDSPSFDPTLVTRSTHASLLRESATIYNATIASADTDLSAFKNRRGKMITWHGLADTIIFYAGTRWYYEQVKRFDPDVEDYYRYFEAPGTGHCRSGVGPYPYEALQAVVRWVEDGVKPDVLKGRALYESKGVKWERDLCKYPSKERWNGVDDARFADAWDCV